MAGKSASPSFAAVETVAYARDASPYEDWIRRGRPDDTCITYATHTNETSDHFALLPHLSVFYMYVDMDWATIEAAVGFRVDLGNRTIALTGAACETRNIWPEMMAHLGLKPGRTRGGITCLRHVMRASKDAGLDEVLRYLFGPAWGHTYGRPAFMPWRTLEVGRACERKCGGSWCQVVGTYDRTRAAAATRIQAAFRGWRVRLRYRFSPHNRLGRHVILRMLHPENLKNS